MMRTTHLLGAACLALLLVAQLPVSGCSAAEPPWVAPMQQVHSGFAGQAGYVAQFGDSITYSMAFWAPLGWTYPDRYLTADDGLPKTPPDKRWRDVLLGTRDKGPAQANYSGWRANQLLQAIGPVLDRTKPELAVIMIGTNDISGNRVPPTYAAQLEQIVQQCMAAHCVPILSTIPPRRDHDQAAQEANAIIRDLAKRLQVPLVDFYAEILQRRPDQSWDGTLIAGDGVHPSGGESHDYSAENLTQCGYALRNWVTFLMVRQVYFRVLHPDQQAERPADPATRKNEPAAGKPDGQTSPRAAVMAQGGQSLGAAPNGDSWAAVCSPRVLSTQIADTYSLSTFGAFDRWRDLPPDQRAYEIYKYLVDVRTGLFHMNVVAEGDDGLSEFVQIRDPVKIINVYGYAYCGIFGPVMAGVCEGVGLGPARTLSLPAWRHVAAETRYENRWHYLDLDVRAVFRRPDGTLASMADARSDASLWQGRGPLFFPNDPLDSTRAIYQSTDVLTFHDFYQSGHTMDYVLRPGEQLTRWWQPQGGRWHHLPQYNQDAFMRRLLASSPRGPKPNHRHFTVHNHGNGLFVYQPQLTDQYQDFGHGVYSCQDVVPGPAGVVLDDASHGQAVFEVRSPYVIVPQVNDLDSVDDDREASVVECRGRALSLSISLDQGLTWQDLPAEFRRAEDQDQLTTRVDLTPWVSGRYGYLLRITLDGPPDQALLSQLKITTWVQVAPAALPALVPGTNTLRLVTGDHHGLPTRVMEIRSRASHPDQLLKYLVAPPANYDPTRQTARIQGDFIARIPAPPGTRIAWFTATGQFRTHQQQQATKTDNQMAYSVDTPHDFQVIYQSDVPTYTNHWHYNAAREVELAEPAQSLYVRYHGDPAVNNFAVYAHYLSDRPYRQLPVTITHHWREGDQPKSHTTTLEQDASYTIHVGNELVNESIQLAVDSVKGTSSQ